MTLRPMASAAGAVRRRRDEVELRLELDVREGVGQAVGRRREVCLPWRRGATGGLELKRERASRARARGRQ